MDVLPTELLMEIFVHCASSSEHALAPIVLIRVCRHWRNVVLALPRAWQHLFLDDERRSIAHSRIQAQMWSARSAPLPFDVELHLHEPDMLLPILSPLLSDIRRWRALTVTGVRHESFRLSSLCDSGVYHPMRRLHIDIEEPTDLADVDDDVDSDTEQSSTFSKCSEDQVHELSMQVLVYTLPLPSLVAPLRITSLNIGESSFQNHTEPVQLLEFLTTCPELETLRFTSWPRDTEHNERSPPIVSLPRLHTLHLFHTCSARTILSHLDTPLLTNVYLAHLNVNFPLQSQYNEEGDSEDEAHDFSQSPSSDQATGMGLRKLITRCNPPIEIFEMDYSDLRTKDFRWCFDRLNHLRQFRIVASDMSDRVVNLFRPFRAPTDAEDAPMRVRLPKLATLELANCQRLSGKVLADAIGSRVRFTDLVTPEATLKDVSIIGCLPFTPWHAEVLQQDVGTRLHV